MKMLWMKHFSNDKAMQIPRTLQKISQIFNKMFTNVQIVFRTIHQFFPFIYLGGGLGFKFLALNFLK